MEEVDCIVAGAGVVGLAVARALLQRGALTAAEVEALLPPELHKAGQRQREGVAAASGR